jgi:hypothetical protein
MTARLADISEAVKVALNGHAFSLAFTATRCYLPRFTLDQLATLRVTVRPMGRTWDLVTRGNCAGDYFCEIGIQKKIDPQDDPAAVDTLIELAEDIQDFLLGETYDGATCIGVAPVLDQESLAAWKSLDELHAYTCVFRLILREP